MFRRIATCVAATALAVSSVAAQAAPAPRTPAPVNEEEQLVGSILWIALAAVALGVAIYFIADSDDSPTSP